MKQIPFFALFSIGIEYFDYIAFPILSPIIIEIFFKNNNTSIINFLFFSLAPAIRIITPLCFLKKKYSSC